DNDGFTDGIDAFPLNANETHDLDNDGIGDNSDPDLDGDGFTNNIDACIRDALEHLDTDGDGVCDGPDLDADGDGLADAVDAFPLDNTETLDTDGDGIGDNSDVDIDGDGITNNFDACETDPLEFLDTDGDGVCDGPDLDADGDGIADISDAFPLDFTESIDTDNDGIGNQLDNDDDGDGVFDAYDLYPLNRSEAFDNDLDGIGDNEDTDDDNDGVLDTFDAFPLDPVESADTDGDGQGNVLDNDDDGDGVYDYIDQLPLNPNETVDTDGDLIGNNADFDDDNDGMSDTFELTHGFNPLDPSDGLLDTDADGVNNADEAFANSNPLLDDYPPVITPPQAIHLFADHTFTELYLSELLSLTQVSVSDGHDGDNCCSLTAVGFEFGPKNIPSGLIPIVWRAIDEAGNIGDYEQVINVHPLVNFSHSQVVAEGGVARVSVVLSGLAPSYPLSLPVTITGSADGSDYQIASHNIIIESGMNGFVDIALVDDLFQEDDEELIIEFKQGVNVGINAKHVITITENNVTPTAEITIIQQGISISSIAKDDGEVEIQLVINDSNQLDTHVIEWHIPEYLTAEISANQHSLFIQAGEVELPDNNHNLMTLSVTITDDGSDNNNDNLSQTKYIAIPVLASQPRLTGSDTDRDGIVDLTEGYLDEDQDGLPAFIDNSTIPYLQPLHVNAATVKLMETEPGLHLNLGKYARLSYSDGVQLSQQELLDTLLVPKDELEHQNEFFDFEIDNIYPFGRSVYVVIPLQNELPKYAVYRKYTHENNWQDFVVDANNGIASSSDVNGVCPAPHSDLYTAGLSVGALCIRLYIEDGGVNDADGTANGNVDDPGGIAVYSNDTIAKQTDPESSSSGGAFSWLLLFLGIVLRNKYRKVAF
ncbi:MAG: thrombospondin type 3 repeat-containing protein, partial [Colwellia sp.]|nr:thrombospondin type 3 repeat-containing protein [Colwellia sp.]